MCHFVTVVLPAASVLERSLEIAAAHGAAFSPHRNPSMMKCFDREAQPFRATARHCDCGTVLGRRRRDSGPRTADESKLRRKGWSEAKIARWREQRHSADENRAARAHRNAESEPDWLGLLRGLRASGAASTIGLLLHLYSGDIYTEVVAVHDKRNIDLRLATLETLEGMEEDVLYTFA